jgi:ABC-2 type transport system ATP-binding protein
MTEETPAFAIEIEGMSKSYRGFKAVRNLTMHVPRGSVYGFVGPNGAGKTTTIRTLATLQRPDAGKVLVEGIDVVEDPGSVHDVIGYMPDFFGVYESLSVQEYLDFYGSSHNIPTGKRRQLCDELLELVNLTDKRNDMVEVLSRGMKQRLGLARCLIHDPHVLLLDEPASGMDPRARIELREILRALGSMDKTILISSHILPELAEMCSHIGIIRAGEMIAEGPVEGVIAALTSGARLRVEVLTPDGLATAEHVLANSAHCAEVETDGPRAASAVYTGNDSELSELLQRLVGAGIPVTGFTMDRGSLEDIFLQITDLGEEVA